MQPEGQISLDYDEDYLCYSVVVGGLLLLVTVMKCCSSLRNNIVLRLSLSIVYVAFSSTHHTVFSEVFN